MRGEHDYIGSIELIEQSYRSGVVDLEEAQRLLYSLEFHERKKDILKWGKYYFPSKFPRDFCLELHEYLVSIRNEPETSTLAPRDHAKTTIMCFLIEIYQALNEPHKYRHYLNVQETATKAITTNLNIRRALENNELLIRDYGDQFNRDKWTDAQFILKNGVIFSCIGAGQSVRGLNVDNVRPDYCVVDDLYELKDVSSRESVRKKTEWYLSDLVPALADSSQGQPVCIHKIGTAISSVDLLHLDEEESKVNPNIKFRRFQAIKNIDTKETLWKPFDWLEMRKKKLGSIIFNREYQNLVRNDEDSVIKEHYIQYFNGDIPGDERVVEKIGGIDPAEKTKDLNDFTGKAAIWRTDKENYYIVDLKNDKLTQSQNVTDIKNWHERLSFDRVKFETNKAYGLFESCREQTNVPLKEVIASKDKITRLIGVSSKFENKKVFISEKIPKPLRDLLVDQLLNNFPTHDDLRDAVVLCLEDGEKSPFFFGIA